MLKSRPSLAFVGLSLCSLTLLSSAQIAAQADTSASLRQRAVQSAMLSVGSDGLTSIALTVPLKQSAPPATAAVSNKAWVRLPELVKIASPGSLQVTPRGLTAQSSEIAISQQPLMQQLLAASLGSSVKILPHAEAEGRDTPFMATVIDERGAYQLESGEIITGIGVERILFPRAAFERVSTPLVALVGKDLSVERISTGSLELQMITKELSWSAAHQLILTASDTDPSNIESASLLGSAIVQNRSPYSFLNTNLKLVAGNRSSAPEAAGAEDAYAFRNAKALAVEESAVMPSAPAQAGENYVYVLPQPADILAGNATTIPLSAPQTVTVSSRFETRSAADWWNESSGKIAVPVNQMLEIMNGDTPLPGGIARVLLQGAANQDSSRSQGTLMGEVSLRHVPAKQRFELAIGGVFDLQAERTQKGFQRQSSAAQSNWEVVIRSSRKSDATVKVIEQLGSNWKIIDSSLKPIPQDAFSVAFEVPVKAGSETILKYTVRHQLG